MNSIKDIAKYVWFLFIHLSITFPLYSQQNLDSLLLEYSNNQHDSTKVKLLNVLSYETAYTLVDSSRFFAKEAIVLSRRINDQSNLGDAYFNLAITYHIQGEFDKAMSYYDSSLIIRKKLNELKGLAGLYNNMGSIFTIQANFPKGMEFYYQSLDIKLKLDDKKGAANTYNNLGIIKYEQKQYSEALELYKQAISLEETIDNPRGLARSLGNIGLVNIKLERFNEAISYYNRAYDLMRDKNVNCLKMYNANGLGEAYLKIGDLKKSKLFATEAYEEALQCDDERIIASSLQNIGQVNALEGRTNLAEKQLIECYDIAKKANLTIHIEESSRAIYEFYKSIGNFEKALNYLEIAQAASDSLINQDLIQKLTTQELNYEFQQEKDSINFVRETERVTYNASLSQKNLIQKVMIFGLIFTFLLILIIYRFYRLKQKSNELLTGKNQIISSALKDKEILIKEIHHRVKNNLQIVSSLLNIQKKFLGNGTAIQAVADIQTRVQSMSLVHQNLYKGNNITDVNSLDYLTDLLSVVQKSYDTSTHDIEIKMEIESVPLSSTQAVNIGLLATELVSNAYKHAFPTKFSGEAQIKVIFKEMDQSLYLEVMDNGVGDKIEASNSSYGMRLIQSLTKSMKGEVNFENNNGSLVKITFPI
jgi:two-component system, sensor histidine kinase PdtaS